MCFGKDLLSYRKRFVHFWGKRLCISEIILCIFLGGGVFLYSRKQFAFQKTFGVLLKKAVLFFRKIFGVIQETFWALLEKDFVYLRQYFVHFLKKDFEHFLQKDFV